LKGREKVDVRVRLGRKQSRASRDTRAETGRGTWTGKGREGPTIIELCFSLGPLQSANLRKKRELRASIHRYVLLFFFFRPSGFTHQKDIKKSPQSLSDTYKPPWSTWQGSCRAIWSPFNGALLEAVDHRKRSHEVAVRGPLVCVSTSQAKPGNRYLLAGTSRASSNEGQAPRAHTQAPDEVASNPLKPGVGSPRLRLEARGAAGLTPLALVRCWKLGGGAAS
jgi:hypothetical protein